MRIFQPTVTGSNTTTGSLHISGPVYLYTLETSSVSHVLVYNTSSGQVFYTASRAVGLRPGDPDQSIQFNSGSEFSGSGNFIFDYNNNIVYLTGSSVTSGSITLTGSMFVSGAISASFGENTVGFYGTASWAQSASQAISASYSSTSSFSFTSSLADTASFVTASNVWGPFGSSSVYSASYSLSSSYSLTASYALNGGGAFSLPVPKVILYNSSSVPFQLYVNIQSYDPPTGGTGITNAKLFNSPRVIAMDITDEMLASHRIFVELVHFKRGRHKNGQSYLIPPSHVDSGGGVYVNQLKVDLGVPLSTRGGKQKWRTNPNIIPAVFADIQVDRPNHYEVTSRNQTIPLYEYLNGWFVKGPITYANTSGGESTFDSWYPSYRIQSGNNPTTRFAYGSMFSPMYVAFRYIAWDASANGSSGAFMSGPLSPIIAIAPRIFPFTQDPVSTQILGWPTVYLSRVYVDAPELYDNDLKCWFVNRLP